MTDREKLIKLIQYEVVPYFAERIADHLIANGVIFAKDINVPSYDEMDFCGELCIFAEELIKKAKPTWIPVSERLPEGVGNVLVCGERGGIYVASYGYRGWHKVNSKTHYCNPTHWMPLPEPPKE